MEVGAWWRQCITPVSPFLPPSLQVRRSTVWRDGVAAERRTGAAVVALRGGAPRSWLARNASMLCLIISLVVFTALLSVEVCVRENEGMGPHQHPRLMAGPECLDAAQLCVSPATLPDNAVTLRWGSGGEGVQDRGREWKKMCGHGPVVYLSLLSPFIYVKGSESDLPAFPLMSPSRSSLSPRSRTAWLCLPSSPCSGRRRSSPSSPPRCWSPRCASCSGSW